MEDAKDGLQGVECIAACEVLPWPECGRPPNTFTHPTPYKAAKPQTRILGWVPSRQAPVLEVPVGSVVEGPCPETPLKP